MSGELDAAIEAARKAGKLQLSRLHSKHKVEAKREKDFVTDVDKESEKIILDAIGKCFPSHAFLAEESGKGKKESEFKWIVDPLDGTHSYMTGLPNFGVSIALEKKGKLVVGVIFLPYLNELLYAEEGKGAFLNSKKIAVSKKADLEGISGSFEFDAEHHSLEQYSKIYGKLFGKTFNMRCFGGTFDFAMVASGRMDFFVSAITHPWDCAAASIITKEAGGKLTDFQGKQAPYISNVVASNGLLHEKILQELNK